MGLIIILLILLPLVGFASPFLVCNSYPTAVVQPDTFEVYIDSNPAVISIAVTNPDNSKQLKHDLAGTGLMDGSHTVKLKACNVWGCSDYSLPFTFTKSVANPPVSIGIQK